MTVRWITPQLGTAAAAHRPSGEYEIVDVRDLVDKGGNSVEAIRNKINVGVGLLEEGKRVVVCCDYGISRSNAVAAGILSAYQKIPLDGAVRKVMDATGEMDIKLEPLEAVRNAVGGEAPATTQAGQQTVLVTGGGGFIGQSLIGRLKDDRKVISPLRDALDIEVGRAQLNLLVRAESVNTIVHLANPRVYTSNIALGSTLVMLRNVLEVCVANDIRLIYPSSWEIYSGYSGSLLADESVPALPRGPYAETKYLAEAMINHWRHTTRLRCTLIRSSPIYGHGGDKPMFLYNFIGKIRQSEPVVTHRYLNGDPALDLLYLDDFVRAILNAVKVEYDGALNIGSGVVSSTREVAELLRAECGGNSPISHTQINSHTARIAMNHAKARDVLGWEPQVNLREGLKRVLAGMESS
jgi:nucleoside-diphosphate-sugar epimerase